MPENNAAERGQRLLPVSAWVFAGGEFQPDCFDQQWLAKDDLVVGVDHGVTHCLTAGLLPDIMLGDFDSVELTVLQDARLKGIKRMSYPARKDRSDLALALEWLCGENVERVVLLGVSGGRSDHHLFNWMLPSLQAWPFSIEMIDSTVHAYVVTPDRALKVSVQTGQTISLVPLHQALGVTTCGLEYPLNDARLDAGSTLGLSNVAAKKTIGVSLNSGRLLVFCVKADKMPA